MVRVRALGDGDLRGLASIDEIVESVWAGYRERGDGAPAKPRTRVTAGDPGGLLTGYLAVLPETGYMGGYTYSAGFGAGDAWFLTPLFDAESGKPVALLDGAWLNPLKTGAVGAVGIDALARADASSLALIGTGRQAIGQLRAALTVREFERIDVYSPTKANREAFAAAFNDRLDAAVSAAASADAAVDGSDVVVTATTAAEPVFEGSVLAEGTHVTAMGQYHPNRRELDDRAIARSTYVPDLRERAFQDAGSFLHALEQDAVDESHIHAELGEVVAGHRPGRPDRSAITIFDSGGTAIETVAAAALLYERAVEADLGTTIDIAPASEAMEPPPR